MNKLYIKIICIFMLTCGSASAQDHPEAPMRGSTDSVLTEKQARYKFRAEQRETLKQNSENAISESFQTEYKKVGSPKIAILWNTKFSDQLREWEGNERLQANRSVALKGVDNRKATVNEKNVDSNEKNIKIEFDRNPDSYARDFNGNYEEASSVIRQTRRWKNSRPSLTDEKADFEFGAGFTGIFLRNKVTVIDRDTIMRLTDLDLNSRAPDAQIIETAALQNHADYLAEILMTPDSQAPVGMSFLVTIKEISSGKIISMLTSDGNTKEAEEDFNDNWVVDESGYRWREDHPPEQKWVINTDGYKPIDLKHSPSLTGQQLAIEVMSELTMAWK